MRDAIRERLGEAALGEGGGPTAPRSHAIVFADRDALAWLEALLHPLVVREYMAWRDELAGWPDPPAVARDRGAAAVRGRRRDSASTPSS